jgi:hypothetical protein
MRKTVLQMLVRDVEKLEKFLCRSAPTALVRGIVLVEIGLVPYFPILDIHMEAVCPALGIMANDMLADDCPFFEIGRGEGVIFLLPMLDLGA